MPFNIQDSDRVFIISITVVILSAIMAIAFPSSNNNDFKNDLIKLNDQISNQSDSPIRSTDLKFDDISNASRKQIFLVINIKTGKYLTLLGYISGILGFVIILGFSFVRILVVSDGKVTKNELSNQLKNPADIAIILIALIVVLLVIVVSIIYSIFVSSDILIL